jgi:hypothetical protein
MAVAALVLVGIILVVLGLFAGGFAMIALGVGALVVGAILETYARRRS